MHAHAAGQKVEINIFIVDELSPVFKRNSRRTILLSSTCMEVPTRVFKIIPDMSPIGNEWFIKRSINIS
jgi:hypothetical protein